MSQVSNATNPSPAQVGDAPDAAQAPNVSAPKCPYPGVLACGACCGYSPCQLEWFRPCDAEGGCWDRATCGGCEDFIAPPTRGPFLAFWLSEISRSDGGAP
jgi:hypothetical protein